MSVSLPFTLTLWEENVVWEENVITAPNDGNAQNVAQPKIKVGHLKYVVFPLHTMQILSNLTLTDW